MIASVEDLEADDYAGAVKVYRRKVLDGTWKSEHASIMFRIIADPDKLSALIVKTNADPEIAKALARLPGIVGV